MFIRLHTKVLSSVITLYAYDFCLYTVISEPDDVTICERTASTLLSCVLNGSISSDDVQWYRLVKGTNTVQRVSDAGDFVDVPVPGQNELTTTLYIFNARSSYTGYYWVRLPLGDVCNTSFTVSTGIFALHYTYTCVLMYNTVLTYMYAYIAQSIVYLVKKAFLCKCPMITPMVMQ